MNADKDGTGYIERNELDGMVQEILLSLAERFDNDPRAAAASTGGATPSILDWFMKPSSAATAPPPAPPRRPNHGHPPWRAPTGRSATGFPAARSADAIKAKYNYKPSEAVLQARQKMEERGKKLEQVADQSEQLEAEAKEYEDLATQLAEKMKTRWW